MNDISNISEEEWVVETPPSLRNSLSMKDTVSSTSSKLASESVDKPLPNYGNIDIYNEAEEVWIVETPPNCKTFQINDNILTFKEKSTSKSLSVSEITLRNDDKTNKSEDKIFKNRTMLRKKNLTNKLEEEWIADSHSCCNMDEISKACEERHRKSYCKQSHFDSESFKTFENYKSFGNRCGKSYNSQTQFELDKINESHKHKYVKSYFVSDENINSDIEIDKKSSSRKSIHSFKDMNKSNENGFINLPYRSVCYKSDKFEGDDKMWKPNIEAPEFVPKKIQSKVNTKQFSPLNNSTYSHFSLRDLLNYVVDLMPSEELTDYANALKLRVLDKLSEFEPSIREELEVLCQLNDGSLTGRNKKIISLRICTLVKRTLANKPDDIQEHSLRYRFRKLDDHHVLI